jgi:choline dehydrogenase-like flavoprotein
VTRSPAVKVFDLERRQTATVQTGAVVVAADAFHTPQLLWASGIRPRALGRHLNVHHMATATVQLGSSVGGAFPQMTGMTLWARYGFPSTALVIPFTDRYWYSSHPTGDRHFIWLGTPHRNSTGITGSDSTPEQLTRSACRGRT